MSVRALVLAGRSKHASEVLAIDARRRGSCKLARRALAEARRAERIYASLGLGGEAEAQISRASAIVGARCGRRG